MSALPSPRQDGAIPLLQRGDLATLDEQMTEALRVWDQQQGLPECTLPIAPLADPPRQRRRRRARA